MKSLLKNLALGLVLFAGIGLVSCSSDSDNYTPSDDAEVQLPMAPEADSPIAPEVGVDLPIAPEAGN